MRKNILLSFVLILSFISLATLGLNTTSVSAQASTSPSCAITSTLRVGSAGAQVVCLQASLSGGLLADGKFGPKTKAAVMSWQSGKGLVADGIFGTKSRAAFTGGVSTNTITILSPNGGENWATGSKQKIYLSTGQTFPSSAVVGFFLEGGPTSGMIGEIMKWNSSGVYEISLPSDSIVMGDVVINFIPGKYKLKAAVYDKTPCLGLCPYPNDTKILAEDSSNGIITVADESVLNKTPVITSISPVSGSTGTQVTITGKNFARSGNSVKFGGGYISELSSNSNGTSITFNLPESMGVCRGDAAVCIAMAMLVSPGTYEVSVWNTSNTSNIAYFTVTN
jgi:hypothetical protein